MKVFAVVTLGRQVQGEYVLLRAEKAFTQASKADEYVKGLAKTFTEKIHTATGPIECLCERGVFEMDVD